MAEFCFCTFNHGRRGECTKATIDSTSKAASLAAGKEMQLSAGLAHQSMLDMTFSTLNMPATRQVTMAVHACTKQLACLPHSAQVCLRISCTPGQPASAWLTLPCWRCCCTASR